MTFIRSERPLTESVEYIDIDFPTHFKLYKQGPCIVVFRREIKKALAPGITFDSPGQVKEVDVVDENNSKPAGNLT